MSDFKKNHFTPKGLIMRAYLFSADSQGKFADDKFKLKLRLFGDDAQKLIDKIDSFIPEASAAEDGNDISMLPYTEALDKDKKAIEGAYDFQFKTKNQPQIIDAKKKKVTRDMLPNFKDGSVVLGDGQVAFRPHHFSIVDRKTKVKDSGIGLYLQAVMIVDLQGGSVDLSQFGEYEDGFTGDTSSSFDGDGEEDGSPDFASK